PRGVRVAKAGVRLTASLLLGVVVSVGAGMFISWRYAPLAGWDAAAVVFLAWGWVSIYHRGGQAPAKLAMREDPGRAWADLLLTLASVASIAGVLVLLVQGSDATGREKILAAGVGFFSVIISWTLVHTLFTLRYARVFYRNRGGIDFN